MATLTVPKFTVTELGGELIAETDHPRLRGIRWWWTPGNRQVDYGLALDQPVSNINVWDYATGAPTIDSTPEALADALADYYLDDYALEWTLDNIRHHWGV